MILMGETGIGKTVLVTILSHFMNYSLEVLNMHAGRTQAEIESFMQGVISQIDLQNPSAKTIVFFDEINTNDSVDGLLKEVVIDRTLFGRPIPSQVVPVAACNPYKLLEGPQRLSVGIRHDKTKDDRFSLLVYRVFPLPESFFYFVWNYNTLLDSDLHFYIRRILELRNQRRRRLFADRQIAEVADLSFHSHLFIREHQSSWSVSLRDVSRFASLIYWFYSDAV